MISSSKFTKLKLKNCIELESWSLNLIQTAYVGCGWRGINHSGHKRTKGKMEFITINLANLQSLHCLRVAVVKKRLKIMSPPPFDSTPFVSFPSLVSRFWAPKNETNERRRVRGFDHFARYSLSGLAIELNFFVGCRQRSGALNWDNFYQGRPFLRNLCRLSQG